MTSKDDKAVFHMAAFYFRRGFDLLVEVLSPEARTRLAQVMSSNGAPNIEEVRLFLVLLEKLGKKARRP
ncbi:MAG: hypothetical protein ACOYYU_10335 [Chloroflexota bacterium]